LEFATSTVDNGACRFDGTTGKTQTSALVIADTTGALSRSGGGGIPLEGTTTNDSASAGYVGEHVSSEVGVGTAVGLATATPTTVTSISLTAGDWDVSGVLAFAHIGTTDWTLLVAGVSLTNNTFPSLADAELTRVQNVKDAGTTGTNHPTLGLPPCRVSVNATTTVYLVAQATFSAGSTGGYGYIRARRVR
jgi:hypothetical protein